MNDFSKFMNEYIVTTIQDSDIIREFIRCGDIRMVAKQFDMNTNSVKAALRRAGILTTKTKAKTDLSEIGMSERDFYEEE